VTPRAREAAAQPDDWRAGFHRDGWTLFPQLCPARIVRAARRAIDRDLADNYDAARQIEYEHQSYCPSLRDSRPIMALLQDSGINVRLDEVIGFNRLDYGNGQVALRRAGNAEKPCAPPPHIDGLPTPFNGVPADVLVRNFTALVGVFLSPVRREFAGNFTVWPGSHHILEQHFRGCGMAALKDGMPQIRLGEPVQVMAEPGDIVLCHYGLAHSAAVNLSDDDRYAVYFRLRLREIDDDPWSFMTEIWKGWLI